MQEVHYNALPSMVDVAHQNHNEEQENIHEAAYAFKMENLDSNREANKLEQKKMLNERKKLAKKKFVD